jgi:hypothetical protein
MNKKESECFEYDTGRIVTTDGQTEKIRVCYCGTTACTKLSKIGKYPLPEDLKKYYEYENEFTKEEERNFYEKL